MKLITIKMIIEADHERTPKMPKIFRYKFNNLFKKNLLKQRKESYDESIYCESITIS